MYKQVRKNVYKLFAPNLGGRTGYFTDWFIMILIAANVAAVMLETVDTLQASYGSFFYWFEIFSVVVFTIEYIARIWSAVEDPNYQGPISGRVEFASRPLLIVDLLAIAPFYLSAIGVTTDLRFLRALRLVRLLRLLKLARYSDSMQAMGAVLRRKKPDLLIALFANILLLIVASSVMFFIEHPHQPEAFPSIPETMWWGVVTLTTVGYGDVHPVTPLGQFVGAIVAILGIGLFALPASILASGFIEEARSQARTCPYCGEEIDEEY